MTNIIELIKNNDLELFELIKNNDLEGVIKAIENGAKVDLQNRHWGKTALHYAVEKGNLKIIKYLVEKGADANLQNEGGRTALHYAKQKGNQEIIDLLTKN